MPTMFDGIYRFDTYAEAKDWAYALGWRTVQVRPYANGYCVQDIRSGTYARAHHTLPPSVTAEVTARGADSTVPDRADAVDASIFADGIHVGDCTLLPDDHGSPSRGGAGLDCWGPGLDHWADTSLMEWIRAHEAVVNAVRREVAP